MHRIRCIVGVFALATSVVVGCSGSSRDSGFDSNKDDTSPSGSGETTGGTGPGGLTGGGGTADGGPAPHLCSPHPDNYDIPGNDCDDDADGVKDNPPTCDDSLAQVGTAEEFARAIGICTKASDKPYGLVSAKFTRGYKRDDEPPQDQHGVLPKFGSVIKPREGKALGVLSTGYAQEYDGAPGKKFGGQEGIFTPGGKAWFDTTPSGTAPPGFPKPAKGCANDKSANDLINVRLEVKAPRNASGVKFDFNFYSGEWPAFICSTYNDSFIAYLTAKGFNGGKPDNMSFDKDGSPVSVNNGFFDRCQAGAKTGCGGGLSAKTKVAACPGGVAELGGTGFGVTGPGCDGMTSSVPQGGATGWLTSQAPVQGGETFTIEFMIWDTGDAMLDSSVLIDDFTWVEGAVETATSRPH